MGLRGQTCDECSQAIEWDTTGKTFRHDDGTPAYLVGGEYRHELP